MKRIDISGKPAEQITRLLGLPGEPLADGYTVRIEKDGNVVTYECMTNEGGAKLSLSRQPDGITLQRLDTETATNVFESVKGPNSRYDAYCEDAAAASTSPTQRFNSARGEQAATHLLRVAEQVTRIAAAYKM